jgi:hypothetical protein
MQIPLARGIWNLTPQSKFDDFQLGQTTFFFHFPERKLFHNPDSGCEKR